MESGDFEAKLHQWPLGQRHICTVPEVVDVSGIGLVQLLVCRCVRTGLANSAVHVRGKILN